MRSIALLSFLVFLPATAFALQINEIMYDLPGADSGREWIEVYQEGNECVNLTQWKFFEANASHKITMKQGESSLCNGKYAVIANDADQFLLDYVGYSGNLFDSSFSLSNTGETIALKNPDGDIVDSVTYSNSLGGDGNGKSLERNASGWFESISNGTPGIQNSISVQELFSQDIEQNKSSKPDIRPANFSPLIDFSIMGHSDNVPLASVVEVIVSASSNYAVNRDVSFCSYVKDGNVLASDHYCLNASLANETRELRLYNTLMPGMSGNLTLFIELRDGVSVRQKSVGLEVMPPKKTVPKYASDVTVKRNPAGAFTLKTNIFDFFAWLKRLVGLR